METGIEKAVRLAGNQTALSHLLKDGCGIEVTPQAVQKWVAQGYVPSNRCRPIETVLKGAVTRYELNPEIFGDAPASLSESRRRSTDEPKGAM